MNLCRKLQFLHFIQVYKISIFYVFFWKILLRPRQSILIWFSFWQKFGRFGLVEKNWFGQLIWPKCQHLIFVHMHVITSTIWCLYSKIIRIGFVHSIPMYFLYLVLTILVEYKNYNMQRKWVSNPLDTGEVNAQNSLKNCMELGTLFL